MLSAGLPCSAPSSFTFENFQRAIGHVAKNLRVATLRIGRQSARQVNRVAEMNVSRRFVGSRNTHIAQHRDDRRIFKVVAPENLNRVERLQAPEPCWDRRAASPDRSSPPWDENQEDSGE